MTRMLINRNHNIIANHLSPIITITIIIGIIGIIGIIIITIIIIIIIIMVPARRRISSRAVGGAARRLAPRAPP